MLLLPASNPGSKKLPAYQLHHPNCLGSCYLNLDGLDLNPIICRNRHDDYYTVDCKALRNSEISVKQP
jgi:hypothetical protein